MDDSDKINNIIENLREQDQQNYGVAVFDIDSKIVKNSIVVFGKVLTYSQKDQVSELAKKQKIKITSDRIKVLSDSSKRYEINWAVVKDAVTDLKLRFVSNRIVNEKILKRIRCSQAFKGEILRVLYKNEDQLLVQQNDLTLGWVDRKDVVLKKISSSSDKACPERESNGGRLGRVRKRRKLDLYKKWKSGNFAIKGKVVKITNRKIAKRFHSPIGTMEPTSEAEKYLGVKYLLGGKTKNGIDCSGLIQVVYKNSLNIILPKHSWNQKEMGEKLKLENMKTGDLVFLIKKSNKHKHVGIVKVMKSSRFVETQQCCVSLIWRDKDINLIHASLEKKRVVEQSLKEVFENYDFVEVRRVAE